VVPTLAFTLWGAPDSMAQTYSYWLIGSLYTEGPLQSRSVGFYKMIQSAGWSLGFALTPSNRLAPLIQLLSTLSCFVIGCMLAMFQLPRAGIPVNTPSPVNTKQLPDTNVNDSTGVTHFDDTPLLNDVHDVLP